VLGGRLVVVVGIFLVIVSVVVLKLFIVGFNWWRRMKRVRHDKVGVDGVVETIKTFEKAGGE
jgi:hypothetical protein